MILSVVNAILKNDLQYWMKNDPRSGERSYVHICEDHSSFDSISAALHMIYFISICDNIDQISE